MHIPISELTKNSIDGIDLSKIFKNNESIYTDSVHVTQKGKEIISKNILNSKKMVSGLFQFMTFQSVVMVGNL